MFIKDFTSHTESISNQVNVDLTYGTVPANMYGHRHVNVKNVRCMLLNLRQYFTVLWICFTSLVKLILSSFLPCHSPSVAKECLYISVATDSPSDSPGYDYIDELGPKLPPRVIRGHNFIGNYNERLWREKTPTSLKST